MFESARSETGGERRTRSLNGAKTKDRDRAVFKSALIRNGDEAHRSVNSRTIRRIFTLARSRPLFCFFPLFILIIAVRRLYSLLLRRTANFLTDRIDFRIAALLSRFFRRELEIIKNRFYNNSGVLLFSCPVQNEGADHKISSGRDFSNTVLRLFAGSAFYKKFFENALRFCFGASTVSPFLPAAALPRGREGGDAPSPFF